VWAGEGRRVSASSLDARSRQLMATFSGGQLAAIHAFLLGS
jgi:hypothetical protein